MAPSGIRLPLALSLLGHAVLLTLFAVLVRAAPPLRLPPATGEIVVSLAPSLPSPEAPPAPIPAPIPPPAAPKKPPPPPEAVKPPPPVPPPPATEATLEPPPPLPSEKPVPRPVMRPLPRRFERPAPPRVAAPAPPTIAAPPQIAAARLPVPPPAAISPGYQALLGAWLERHKRYPDTARERAEEGRAVLRFVVDRSGRVVDFAIVESTGYADLDAGLVEMMRGANLPPFPADMPQASVTVRVAIRFSLAR